MTPPAASQAQAREFAGAFRPFLAWVQAGEPVLQQSPVTARVAAHLGERVDASVVTSVLPPLDHVNLQVALDAWSVEPDRSVEVLGVSPPPHHGPLELTAVLHGQLFPGVRVCAPDLVDLPTGPDTRLAVLTLALLLVHDARGPYVLLVRGPQPHEDQRLVLEIAGLAPGAAQQVLRELAELRTRHNVSRGQLLELVVGDGGPTVAFSAGRSSAPTA